MALFIFIYFDVILALLHWIFLGQFLYYGTMFFHNSEGGVVVVQRLLCFAYMNFSQALLHAQKGRKITRSGWNGIGMFVVVQKGYPDGIPINQNTAHALGISEGTLCRFAPYLMLAKPQPDGSYDCVTGWLASQTDLLANDWHLVEN